VVVAGGQRVHTRGRVVALIDALGPGGAEALTGTYAPRLRDIGFDVKVVVLQERAGNLVAKRLQDSGIDVDLVRVDRLLQVRQIARLMRCLRRKNADLIHAHLEFSSILGSLFRRVAAVPLVATLHTLERPNLSGRDGMRLRLMSFMLNRCADQVICLSQMSAELGRRSGIVHAPIEVLPNGIEIDRYSSQATGARVAVRSALGIDQDVPLVACVAVLRRLKGIHVLIEAFKPVHAKLPSARLLVVGDGPERAALAAQVQEQRLNDVVVFGGFRNDIPEILHASDLFVLPTLQDALPTVLMEAMAARLPIVASATGGIPEMIENGVSGLLTPPGDPIALASALVRVLTDKKLAAELAAAGRERVQAQFSLDGQVARLAAIYDTLIAKRLPR
jgi:glycosyltransferase involved in cell wall biosynthesis